MNVTIPFPLPILTALPEEKGVFRFWKSPDSDRRLFQMEIGCCLWCGNLIREAYPHWEHVIPEASALDYSIEQLQMRIHYTFELVRRSVETELHGNSSPSAPSPEQVTPASPKQIRYLLDLARMRGVSPQQIAAKFKVESIQKLTRQQCFEQINEWRAA